MDISMVLVFGGFAEVEVLRYWAPLPTTGLKALVMSGFLKRSMPIWADAEEATKRQITSTVRPKQQRFMVFSLRTAPAVKAPGGTRHQSMSFSYQFREAEATPRLRKTQGVARKELLVGKRFDRIKAG